MIDQILISFITPGSMSIILWYVFIHQEKYKLKKERVVCAQAISTELNEIKDVVEPLTWSRHIVSTDHLVGDVPRNTYDGIMSSAKIVMFSEELQRQLHTFYRNVTSKQYDEIRNTISILIKEINEFRQSNE